MHLQIQHHAAAALSNLGQRCLYGELWQPAVQTIADALVSLQKREDDEDRPINAGMPKLLLSEPIVMLHSPLRALVICAR